MEYAPILIHPDLANRIRREWFQDYDIEALDNIRFFNQALEWLRKNGELENYRKYWFVFSKNDKRLHSTKKVVLDLGMVHKRTEKNHICHVFFVKEGF
jgi:hypothetical protein